MISFTCIANEILTSVRGGIKMVSHCLAVKKNAVYKSEHNLRVPALLEANLSHYNSSFTFRKKETDRMTQSLILSCTEK